jgi:hypothetical protein
MCGDEVFFPEDPEATGWLCGEPRLDELLADPVLDSLMRSDRVDPVRFRIFLDEVRRKARARHRRERAGDLPGGR